jgi:non-ribosomal peptide synthetase component F
MDARITYATDLFDADTVARMGQQFGNLLASVAAAPAAPLRSLKLMSAGDEQLVLRGFNDTAGPLPTKCVHQFFEQQADAAPQGACLIDSATGCSVTYAEVNAASNRLARHLVSAGVAADAPVALLMDKCFEAYVAITAILKAGGCYVPIDFTLPAARVAEVLNQSGAQLLLVSPDMAAMEDDLPPVKILIAQPLWRQFAKMSSSNLEHRSSIDNTVYMLFTSGAAAWQALYAAACHQQLSLMQHQEACKATTVHLCRSRVDWQAEGHLRAALRRGKCDCPQGCRGAADRHCSWGQDAKLDGTQLW